MYGTCKADVDRQYLKRCDGGRGLIGAEECVQAEVNSLDKYLSASEEKMLKEAGDVGFLLIEHSQLHLWFCRDEPAVRRPLTPPPLLDLVTAEELDLFMKASSINLDTCIGILKNGAKCRMGARLFLKLANSLSDTGFQCNTCSPEHQSLIDRTLAKVRASPDCPALATAISHANLC
ncbi:uncharacterized protein LOC119568340 [Penaeus monodon]|uniref:uncharacterized protein LOC119568340 n=1 Tax=Penaeus monodon TaxID=6687 RepID=UPI0018A74FDB|nr:uncharacterized protein LOC119568340 [Penaeus monodon]